jgi:hypothetical protein
MTAQLEKTARDLMKRQAKEARRRKKAARRKRQVLRDLVWNENVLAGIILSLWKWVRETLEQDGFEGRELVSKCQVLLAGIDGCLTRYEQFVVDAEEAGLTSEAVRLQDLEVQLPALREARPKVAELLDFSTRPPRSIDEAMLNKSKEAAEHGEFVTLDDEYLARLRAGQDF